MPALRAGFNDDDAITLVIACVDPSIVNKCGLTVNEAVIYKEILNTLTPSGCATLKEAIESSGGTPEEALTFVRQTDSGLTSHESRIARIATYIQSLNVPSL